MVATAQSMYYYAQEADMQDNMIIIGISGPSGSGKSLLASTIVKEIGSDQVVIISEDSYYKHHPEMNFEERAKINFDHPDAFEHDLLCEQLTCLQKGEAINVPLYDHSQHLRKKETRRIDNHRIVVLEGILLFSERRLREMMDIRIFMDTALDICLLRRMHRDIMDRGRTVSCVMKQYEETVRPMYMQFIEPSKRYADIIVPRGGENRIAIDLIKAKMRELLIKN